MRVRVIRSFSGMLNGQMFAHSEGDEFEMPAGVDWLRAGFVVPVVAQGPGNAETAALEPRSETTDARPAKRLRSAKATE